MKKCWQMVAFVLAIVLATLACGGKSTPSTPFRFSTSTPDATQTPVVIVAEITTTPLPTTTPIVVIETVAPPKVLAKCVSASVAVHLRPSPSTDNYPIEVLANGTKVTDLGGRSGDWMFVSVEDKQGWINSEYLSECE